MKDYNGFSGFQRGRAQSWLNAQWASGKLARPKVCCACGQTEGVIDAHAEDYSEPFTAGKTDGFHLCFICHMMVHCRFRNPLAWKRYVEAIERGVRFVALGGRNFPRFSALFLSGDIMRAAHTMHAPPADSPLRRISDPAHVGDGADAGGLFERARHQGDLSVN